MIRAVSPPANSAVLATIAATSKRTVSFEWHLARRVSIAPTYRLVNTIRKTGWATWLKAQIYSDSTFDTAAVETIIKKYYPWGFYDHTRYLTYTENWRFGGMNRNAAMLRRLYSEQHLRETMVEFWGDLIHVSSMGDAKAYITQFDSRQRKNALGLFSTLLYESELTPAMIRMLTNHTNTVKAVNENMAREMLELHTVGVDGGFSEKDVQQTALLLTGFNHNYDTSTFEFKPRNHYYGPLKIMGWSHRNSDTDNTLSVFKSFTNYLASHPATAQRIAERLVARFCSETQGPAGAALAASLATTYLANKTDIKPVLWELFNSKHFKDSVGTKIARPGHIVARNYAAMNTTFSPAAGAYNELLKLYSPPGRLDNHHIAMGHQFRGRSSPAGDPDEWQFWLSSNMVRTVTGALALECATQSDPWFKAPDWATTLGLTTKMTVSQLAETAYARIHGFFPDAAVKKAIEDSVSRFGTSGGIPSATALEADRFGYTMHLILAAPHSFIR